MAASTPAPRQRLVLCLDGTWNNRDSSTNVLHQAVLTSQGDTGDGFVQKVYYDEGVGNGVLDGISGGGFGIGLERNVREAYNWLVAHFNDAGRVSKYTADEIYIFGFSRGAYTARSLVGFISRCGLLRRGAPLTVEQLWRGYCLLGRDKGDGGGFWDAVAGEARPPFRALNRLCNDPWLWDRVWPTDLNATERLLTRWSRRVRITYLGVYDTVGAVGLDALAIPGVRGRIALHHNLRPTKLIERCRHALAIDENRASFNHTPFVKFHPHNLTESATTESEAVARWADRETDWAACIEQAWFVGAHSNIGGGYPDNALAQRPLAWMLAGARACGLVCADPDERPPKAHARTAAPLPAPVDSYAAFAAPFATHLLRLKRNYRHLDPAPEIRASVDHTTARRGFELKSINESIDDSTVAYFDGSAPERTPPPNLVNYARRHSTDTRLAPIRAAAIDYTWPAAPGFRSLVTTILWAAAAGYGTWSALRGLLAWSPPAPFGFVLLAVVAIAAVCIDWAETRQTFRLALGDARGAVAATTRPWRDTLFWLRACAVVLAVAGAFTALGRLWQAGWQEYALRGIAHTVAGWLPLALTPIAAAFVTVCLLRHPRPTPVKTGALALLGTGAAIGCALLIAVAAFGLRKALGIAFSEQVLSETVPVPHGVLGGGLLLLFIGAGVLAKGLVWVGNPLRRANLPAITNLQRQFSAERVNQLFADWSARLHLPQFPPEDPHTGRAAARVREALREALWRDVIGFVPLSAVVLGFGLWFAHGPVGWTWLGWAGLHLWAMPLFALLDWTEDRYHLCWLDDWECGRPPADGEVKFVFLVVILKFAVYLGAMAITLAAMARSAWQLARAAPAINAAGSLALLIAAAVVAAALVTIGTWAITRLRPRA